MPLLIPGRCTLPGPRGPRRRAAPVPRATSTRRPRAWKSASSASASTTRISARARNSTSARSFFVTVSPSKSAYYFIFHCYSEITGNPFRFQYFPPSQKYSLVSLDPVRGDVRPEYGIRLSVARDGSQEMAGANARNLRGRTVYLKIPFDFSQASFMRFHIDFV